MLTDNAEDIKVINLNASVIIWKMDMPYAL